MMPSADWPQGRVLCCNQGQTASSGAMQLSLFLFFSKAVSLPRLSSALTVKVLLFAALNCCCFVAQLAEGSFQKGFAFFARRETNWELFGLQYFMSNMKQIVRFAVLYISG